MMKSISYGVVLCLFWLPFLAVGAEVAGLYEAEIQVYSQKRSERATAMVSALAEVLAKVSGQRDAALVQGVAQAIRRPAKLLQQYRYKALPEADSQAQALGVEGGEPQLIVFRFDKRAVDKVLNDNALPVWGATRPSTLVWLAVEDGGERLLLGSDSTQPARQSLLREAKRRGMALVLPLMDLEDQIKLSFADVWGGFRSNIEAASERYRTESILVGRVLREANGEWSARWSLLEKDGVRNWRADGVLLAEVLDAGVAGAIDVLASIYAPKGGSMHAGMVPLTVTAVHNLSDYARVTHYLQSLQLVSHVYPTSIEADRIRFHLDAKGTEEEIAQTIALGDMLTPEPASTASLNLDDENYAVSSALAGGKVYQLAP
jgi:hypothetical protein